jgi:hypothetical protein
MAAKVLFSLMILCTTDMGYKDRFQSNISPSLTESRYELHIIHIRTVSYQIWLLHTSFLTKYSYSDQIKEDEMGGECGTKGRKLNACMDWWENLKQNAI